MPPSRRSGGRAEQWQDRFDRLLVAASVAAVLGVALQTLTPYGPLHTVGTVVSAASWSAFAVDAAVMLAVSPRPGAWARSHAFELVVLVVACPLWPALFYDALVLQLAPALTVLEATKLAKLVKVARTVRSRGDGRLGGRVLAGVVLVLAAAVAVLILRH